MAENWNYVESEKHSLSILATAFLESTESYAAV